MKHLFTLLVMVGGMWGQSGSAVTGGTLPVLSTNTTFICSVGISSTAVSEVTVSTGLISGDTFRCTNVGAHPLVIYSPDNCLSKDGERFCPDPPHLPIPNELR